MLDTIAAVLQTADRRQLRFLSMLRWQQVTNGSCPHPNRVPRDLVETVDIDRPMPIRPWQGQRPGYEFSPVESSVLR
jgi:hypothetical protein